MMRNGTSTSFGPLKQINAGVLNVEYAEAGPPDGRAVLLLHGWPYDIHSYVDVAPRLSQAGYRVIVPYLRGYGTNRFLSSETFRNAQQFNLPYSCFSSAKSLKSEEYPFNRLDHGEAVVQPRRRPTGGQSHGRTNSL